MEQPLISFELTNNLHSQPIRPAKSQRFIFVLLCRSSAKIYAENVFGEASSDNHVRFDAKVLKRPLDGEI